MCKRVNGAVVSASPSLPLPSEGAFLQRERPELHRAADEDLPVRDAGGEGGHFLRSVRPSRRVTSTLDASNTRSSDALSCYRAAKKAPT